jgi:phytoene synthase
MAVSALHWESHLLSLAQEAIDSHIPEERTPPDNSSLLEQAYRYCEEITQLHSKTFYLASGLLPDFKRRAVRALYAFCRISDDLVDRSTGDALLSLEEWRQRALISSPSDDDAVALAWSDTRQVFQIPWGYSEQLIEGVAQDLRKNRYQSFSELATYCYGVACTVGLMSMHIIGYSGPEAFPYAIRLGVALQATNILRDVGEDWRAGRLYLPQEELEDFGISESDIANGVVDDRWRKFMHFQIERVRRLYASALPGIPLLDREGRFAIGAAAELYQAILSDIEAHDYDVFNRRASINKWGKIHRLPGIWWRSTYSRYPIHKG